MDKINKTSEQDHTEAECWLQYSMPQNKRLLTHHGKPVNGGETSRQWLRWVCDFVGTVQPSKAGCCPSDASQWRCKLTPYSQKAHLNYLTVGSFWGHSVSSQRTHKMTHTVSLLWAFREFADHTMSLLWAIHEITRWPHHAVVVVISLWELQTHRKFIASSQCELILWVHC